MQSPTPITKLLQIKFPIIQAGMIYAAGWKLAATVSNSGGLGLIGAGSMKPDELRDNITKCKETTSNPFGVNVPLLRKDAVALIETAKNMGVKIFFTSAGNPAKVIDLLKEDPGIVAIHVVSNVKQGKKAEEAGFDAVVGEGVEAGGHNGIDEITTMCLVPQLSDALKIPVIAAGGIADGRQIAAAFALGASAVQIGTLFASTTESAAHEHYKKQIVHAIDTDTVLAFRKIGMVRMLKNDFAMAAVEAEKNGVSEDELKALLKRKRAKFGISDGDVIDGELEAGQSAGLVKQLLSVQEVFIKLVYEYNGAIKKLSK